MRLALVALLGVLLPLSAVAQSTQPTSPPPSPTLKATHGQWEVQCYGPDDCIMVQLHKRTAETADAVFTIFRPKGLTDNAGQPILALAEIVVPLGVFLPGALGLQVDQNEPRAVPFERCIPDGCVVRAPIAPAMLEQMKVGGTAHIILSPSPEDRVRLPISLSGFTAAFDSL